MVQGTFFKVDTDSLLSEGQVIFRYLAVHRKEVDESKSHHHYPVYAVLKPYAIDFYYHGPDEEKDNNKNDIHIHACILHLPLSLNLAVKDNLTARLSRMFYDPFSIGKDYTFDLSIGRTAYWNLPVFRGNRGGIEKESIDKENSAKKIVLRKLILDFIFDLEHSKVFEASPHYEEVEVHLRENYFFNAIAAKAAYYYTRKKYLDNITNEHVGNLYAQTLAEAELQWLNILRDQRATESFWHEDWFDKVEEEYKKVLFCVNTSFNRYAWRRQLQEDDEKFDEKNIRILRESARWFLRRYGLVNGIKTLLQYKPATINLIFLSLFSFLIFPNILADFNHQSNFMACFVYVLAGIVPFLIVFLCVYRKMFLPIVGALLPRLIMAIASAWLFFTTTEELWKSSFDIRLGYRILWVLLFLIPITFFMAVEIRNSAPDIKPWYLIRRMAYVLGFGLLYSILIGMFLVHFTGDRILPRSGYLQEFYFSTIQKKTPFTITDTCVAIGLGLQDDENDAFAKYKNMKCDSGRDKSLFVKINYLKDKMNARYSRHFQGSWENIIQNSSADKAYEQLIDFFYDADFGVFCFKKVRLKYHIKLFKDSWKINVFPGLLFYRSFFALFIGIFIQLIFEDKPITEPL